MNPILALLLSMLAAFGLLEPAERSGVQFTASEPPPSIYAPEGLSDCDEMNWYREAVGLPDAFGGIGWRESNCRNEEAVKTWCCHGWWQLWVELHLQDHRLAPRYAECGITSHHDVNSDTPEDKLRQACGAKALYDVNGTTPWVATR